MEPKGNKLVGNEVWKNVRNWNDGSLSILCLEQYYLWHGQKSIDPKSGFESPKTWSIFGLENKEGRIKNGYQADLVILNSNPLDDISNTQDIYGVIKNGEFLSRESLDSLMYKN